MSRIFLSHSSNDNASAVALRDWLETRGWDDVFLDVDLHKGIAAGDRWEQALNQAALRCEAVLLLVSRAWLSSDWCLKEFQLAHRLNKRLFGILIEDIAVSELPVTLTGTWQLVSLVSSRDQVLLQAKLPRSQEEVSVAFSLDGLNRLRIGLERAGLDPKFFLWPPRGDLRRPPYRGLLPLSNADAGIFFGREAPTIQALDRIRGMKDGAAPRLMVLLGASGAGKSSFLQAGILPRLARDDRNYVVLPTIRPERAAMSGESGLLRSLESAFTAYGLPLAYEDFRAATESGVEALRVNLRALIDKLHTALLLTDTSSKPPVLILAIDQAEELFLNDGMSESIALLNLLRELVSEDAPTVLSVIAIRSDAYERLQICKALEGIAQQPLSLPPMPRGAYQAVIEGPASRLRETDRPLAIDPALTEALLADIEEGGGRDALPLLAFTLERLYLEYGANGQLTLKDYGALGRIRGSIEAAVERAFQGADTDSRIPQDQEARLILLRRGLIPWLAGIDPDTGHPRRQKALMSEIPEEARPLINLLVEQRLLSTDVTEDTRERTIEPAHESLLRQWGALESWLQEDFAALSTLEAVKRSARDWAANAKSEEWLSHRSGRLDDAETLLQRADLSANLAISELNYLHACREREENERKEKNKAAEREIFMLKREKLRAKRTTLAAACVALVMTGIGAALYFQKTKADTATTLASENATVARKNEATAKFQTELADTNLKTALVERKNTQRSQSMLLGALGAEQNNSGDSVSAMLLTEIAIRNLPEDAPHQDTITLRRGLHQSFRSQRERLLLPLTGLINSSEFIDRGSKIATSDSDAISLWDTFSGKKLSELSDPMVFPPETDPDESAAASPYGTRRFQVSANSSLLVTLGFERSYALLWDTRSASILFRLEAGETIASAAFSPDQRRIAIAAGNHVQFWDTATGKLVKSIEMENGAGKIVFSPDGKFVAVGSPGGAVTINTLTGKVTNTGGCKNIPGTFSPDSKRVVMLEACSGSKEAIVWDASTGKQILALVGLRANIWIAAFSPDGRQIITADRDSTVQIWEASSGRRLATFNHPGSINAASFSGDGKLILTASSDRSARVWDLNGREVARYSGHQDEVVSASFSPDGKQVVTSSTDKTTRVWTVDSLFAGNVIRRGQTTDSANFKKGDVEIRSIRLSNDGAILAAIDNNSKRVLLIDINSSSDIASFNLQASTASFSPDGKLISFILYDGSVVVYDIASKNSYYSAEPPAFMAIGVTFFDQGHFMLSYSQHLVRLHDMRNKRLVRSISLPKDISLSNLIVDPKSEFFLALVNGISPDARVVALRQDFKEPSQPELFEMPETSDATPKSKGLSLSANGRHLLVAFSDMKIRAWETMSMRFEKETDLKAGDISFDGPDIFSSGGETVVGTDSDNNIKLVDTDTGLELDRIYKMADGAPEVSQRNGTVAFVDIDLQGKGDRAWQIVSSHIFTQSIDDTLHISSAVPRCLTRDQLTLYSVERKQAAWCEQKWPSCLTSNVCK